MIIYSLLNYLNNKKNLNLKLITLLQNNIHLYNYSFLNILFSILLILPSFLFFRFYIKNNAIRYSIFGFFFLLFFLNGFTICNQKKNKNIKDTLFDKIFFYNVFSLLPNKKGETNREEIPEILSNYPYIAISILVILILSIISIFFLGLKSFKIFACIFFAISVLFLIFCLLNILEDIKLYKTNFFNILQQEQNFQINE